MSSLTRCNPVKNYLGHNTRATQPGQLVQIDHLSVSLDGTQLKEFRAVSPVGKHMVTRVYSRATRP